MSNIAWVCNIGECKLKIEASTTELLQHEVSKHLRLGHDRKHLCFCAWPLVVTEKTAWVVVRKNQHIEDCGFSIWLGRKKVAIADESEFPAGPGMWCVWDYGNSGGMEARRMYDTLIDAVMSLDTQENILWWPSGTSLAEAYEAWVLKRQERLGD